MACGCSVGWGVLVDVGNAMVCQSCVDLGE